MLFVYLIFILLIWFLEPLVSEICDIVWKKESKYNIWFDLFMILVTCGLWLIYMRFRRKKIEKY